MNAGENEETWFDDSAEGGPRRRGGEACSRREASASNLV